MYFTTQLTDTGLVHGANRSAVASSSTSMYRFLHEYEGSTAESCPRRDSGKGWMSSGADRV